MISSAFLDPNVKCDNGSYLCSGCLEHAGYVPVRLRPHAQPHGQQGRRGSRDHPGQPVGPPDSRGGQREGGTYHRLPGGLQRRPAQGTIGLSPPCLTTVEAIEWPTNLKTRGVSLELEPFLGRKRVWRFSFNCYSSSQHKHVTEHCRYLRPFLFLPKKRLGLCTWQIAEVQNSLFAKSGRLNEAPWEISRHCLFSKSWIKCLVSLHLSALLPKKKLMSLFHYLCSGTCFISSHKVIVAFQKCYAPV